MRNAAPIPDYPVADHAFRVNGVTRLSVDTFEVELQSLSGSIPEYHAGQYLQLNLDLNGDGIKQSFSYSIANRFNPDNPSTLSLFIQIGSDTADRILTHLINLHGRNSALSATLPLGRAYLQTNLESEHLLVASGSGISKIKCLSNEILLRRPDAHLNIYWSNKNIDQFYLVDHFNRWVKEHKNVRFTPILESPREDWTGRTGYLYQVIQDDLECLKNVQAYLCGSPTMVYGTIDQLKNKGLKEVNCYSDVFEYAPRNQKIAI